MDYNIIYFVENIINIFENFNLGLFIITWNLFNQTNNKIINNK